MINSISTNLILCNVCGCDLAKPLWVATDRLHGFEGQFQYVCCLDCGLIYMNPQVTPESISQFYPDDYAPHQAGHTGEKESRTKWVLPKVILDSLNPDSRVLDVGCGNGDFLNKLRQFCHCQVYGLDFSQNAVNSAQKQFGIEVFHGDFLAAPYKPAIFDLVTLWSCIEHLHNPTAAIQKAFSLCKPGGWLFIKTPNHKSLAAKCFRDKWYHLDCPRHLFIFSPSTMKMLLKNCGFEKVKIGYELSSKGWLGSLQYVFYGDNFNQKTKNKIRRSSMAKMFVSPVSHLAAVLKYGDTMIITARRKK
jgi:SAM-dependent methyltransferase